MFRVVGLHVFVSVPGIGVLISETAMIKLHKPYATLDQASRHQALTAERFCDLLVQTVELSGGRCLCLEVDHFRRTALHSVGEFVRLDASRKLRVAWILLEVHAIEFFKKVEARALLVRTDA